VDIKYKKNLSNDETYKTEINNAISLGRKRKYKDAIKIYKKWTKLKPNKAASFCMLGNIYLHHLKNPRAAVRCFQKASRIHPQNELISIGLFHSLNSAYRAGDAWKEMKRFCKLGYSKEYAFILDEINAGNSKTKKRKIKPSRHSL